MSDPCPKCGYVPKPAYDNLYDDLFRQTPKEVWLAYLANGYMMRDAIKEERSYE